MDCEWTIQLPESPKQVLRVSFDDPFGIAGSLPKCKKDWIVIESLDANQTTVVSERGPLCSLTRPQAVLTDTGVARVRFHAGPRHGSARKGFKIHYEALEVCQPTPPPLDVEGK